MSQRHLQNSHKAKQKVEAGSRDHDGILGLYIMTECWADMVRTTLPSWISKASSNWGTTRRGKLSSGEWHVICLVHLPVMLIRLWGSLDLNERKRLLLDNFMHLVEAIISATFKQIRQSDVEDYRAAIVAYLTGYKELFKDMAIYPVQHAALHFDEKLLDFGPSSGQNGDFYERHIHKLQETNFNNKFGELEATMLKASCRRANLQALLLDNPDVAEHASDLLSKFQDYLDEDSRGTRLAHLQRASHPATNIVYKPQSAQMDGISASVLAHIHSVLSKLHRGCILEDLPTQSLTVPYISLRGIQYAISEYMPGNSDIVYRKAATDPALAAGQITKIYVYSYQVRSAKSRRTVVS